VALTPAERQVASLLLLGLSDKEIAHEMGIAMSSVSTLAQRIRAKLGCGTGQELLHLSDPDETTALAHRRSLFERLTVAEREVAVELLAGATYADIAQGRGCAVRTVAAQCASLFRKSGISGKRGLAAALLGGRSCRENDDAESR
jgi:DNA-binding CsgD family transcriptional regulator